MAAQEVAFVALGLLRIDSVLHGSDMNTSDIDGMKHRLLSKLE
jgi:hypothetical protein